MARLLWPVRSMATAIAAEARAPRRPPLALLHEYPVGVGWFGPHFS